MNKKRRVVLVVLVFGILLCACSEVVCTKIDR